MAFPTRPPLLEPGQTYGSVTERITGIALTKNTPIFWFITFTGAFALLNLMMFSIGWLLYKGTGVWGLNIPVGWGFAIINFVWWIGIGHAGTLISAILFLLHQTWRNSINRFAEAMTLFAVACAGLFPLLHVGRPWRAYWLFPYPNTMGMWPQFRSPLLWDVFAVSTYATVSALFWFVGLVPDAATMRDNAKSKIGQRFYGAIALGWRNSAKHWNVYETASLLLAGLATPLVLSVHSIVSFDFAISIVPGWHTTIFPPYFVAGAIYSGFAMVLTLMLPFRKLYHMESLVTERHIDNMAKVMLATGLMVGYGYLMEVLLGWYNGNIYEVGMLFSRFKGPYWPAYWALILCNIVIPQALWWRKIRLNVVLLWLITIVINIGMWLERFVIVVISLHRDFLPSSWGIYHPTFWDISLFIGTMGLFMTLLMLFIRFIPTISIFETRHLLHETMHKDDHHGS
jgi:Ni/Fe-hydrogenase subunit HybB-like protein